MLAARAPLAPSRRQLLLSSLFPAAAVALPRLARPPPSLAAALALARYTDPGGRFQLDVPADWRQVAVAPGAGILASWYDAARPGSDTIAVYAAHSSSSAASTAELGDPQAVGEALAAASPGGSLLSAQADTRADGRAYVTTHVLFSGVSAGAFGKVLDVRCSVVAQGTKFTLRASCKHPPRAELQGALASVVASFVLLL